MVKDVSRFWSNKFSTPLRSGVWGGSWENKGHSIQGLVGENLYTRTHAIGGRGRIRDSNIYGDEAQDRLARLYDRRTREEESDANVSTIVSPKTNVDTRHRSTKKSTTGTSHPANSGIEKQRRYHDEMANWDRDEEEEYSNAAESPQRISTEEPSSDVADARATRERRYNVELANCDSDEEEEENHSCLTGRSQGQSPRKLVSNAQGIISVKSETAVKLERLAPTFAVGQVKRKSPTTPLTPSTIMEVRMTEALRTKRPKRDTTYEYMAENSTEIIAAELVETQHSLKLWSAEFGFGDTFHAALDYTNRRQDLCELLKTTTSFVYGALPPGLEDENTYPQIAKMLLKGYVSHHVYKALFEDPSLLLPLYALAEGPSGRKRIDKLIPEAATRLAASIVNAVTDILIPSSYHDHAIAQLTPILKTAVTLAFHTRRRNKKVLVCDLDYLRGTIAEEDSSFDKQKRVLRSRYPNGHVFSMRSQILEAHSSHDDKLAQALDDRTITSVITPALILVEGEEFRDRVVLNKAVVWMDWASTG